MSKEGRNEFPDVTLFRPQRLRFMEGKPVKKVLQMASGMNAVSRGHYGNDIQEYAGQLNKSKRVRKYRDGNWYVLVGVSHNQGEESDAPYFYFDETTFRTGTLKPEDTWNPGCRVLLNR